MNSAAESSAESSAKGPLDGLLVLDLTRVLAGPYATMVLADLGARVIKVEPPFGDDARGFGPFSDGKSAYFESLNRGKESIALDLKAPDDRAVFARLADAADVLVENYRAGAMDRLGFGYEKLRQSNPRLIYAAISGFGQTGPYRDQPAYDLVVQAMGGIISVTGDSAERPARVGTSIGDIAAGLFGLSGILAALHQRARSGRGCLVDVGMLDCQVAILENAIGRYLAAGESPVPLGLRHPSITPFDGFRARDRLLVIAAGNDALFAKLCAAIGAPSLSERDEFASNDLRAQNHAELKRELERALRKKRADEWLAILRDAGVPCAPINDIEQVVADAHVNARNMIVETRADDGAITKMAGNPIKISDCADPPTRRAAPQLDQDREEIMELLAALEG